MRTSYITLGIIRENKININKSVFITEGLEVHNHQQAINFIAKIKAKFPDATHHCWAYIIGDNIMNDDDGEPGGTAGLPILNVIKRNNLNNIIVVVIRYFGGKKLGVKGLIDAYRLSAEKLIGKSIKVKRNIGVVYKICCDYNYANKIATSNDKRIKVLNQEFSDTVVMIIFVEIKAVKEYDYIFKNSNIQLISKIESIN